MSELLLGHVVYAVRSPARDDHTGYHFPQRVSDHLALLMVPLSSAQEPECWESSCYTSLNSLLFLGVQCSHHIIYTMSSPYHNSLPGSKLTVDLLAGDALDVDNPLFPVHLHDLALTALCAATVLNKK